MYQMLQTLNLQYIKLFRGADKPKYTRSGGTSKTYESVQGGGSAPKINEIERTYFEWPRIITISLAFA